ncbi:hypothetical protein EVAR_90935_1 [Eumeta japonica]|uniref:Uncharacterized protein n=1 Tax=Eumeta variegata TaxID=151549 RepID=A0A4C1SPY5_EUMVA|nr:hypothetical protein EVAR_90935_1 [Eumeta japonica]
MLVVVRTQFSVLLNKSETRRSIPSVVKIQLNALLSKCVTPNNICGVEKTLLNVLWNKYENPIHRTIEQERNTMEHPNVAKI